jgi:hypothetical protein
MILALRVHDLLDPLMLIFMDSPPEDPHLVANHSGSLAISGRFRHIALLISCEAVAYPLKIDRPHHAYIELATGFLKQIPVIPTSFFRWQLSSVAWHLIVCTELTLVPHYFIIRCYIYAALSSRR